jgi:hypothetical protein
VGTAGLIQEYPVTYQEGHLSVENGDLIERLNLRDCLFGIQVASDGRVWVCVNGLAYLRFKPGRVTGG